MTRKLIECSLVHHTGTMIRFRPSQLHDLPDSDRGVTVHVGDDTLSGNLRLNPANPYIAGRQIVNWIKTRIAFRHSRRALSDWISDDACILYPEGISDTLPSRSQVADQDPPSTTESRRLVVTQGTVSTREKNSPSGDLTDWIADSFSKSLRTKQAVEEHDVKKFDWSHASLEEIGRKGEEIIYEVERNRVEQIGLDPDDCVEWRSSTSPYSPFDILSVKEPGHRLWIEVKSSSDRIHRSAFISVSELKVAIEKRDAYWLYKVSNVDSASPVIDLYKDPVGLWEQGLLSLELQVAKITF